MQTFKTIYEVYEAELSPDRESRCTQIHELLQFVHVDEHP
jgi:hypothetical protein